MKKNLVFERQPNLVFERWEGGIQIMESGPDIAIRLHASGVTIQKAIAPY